MACGCSDISSLLALCLALFSPVSHNFSPAYSPTLSSWGCTAESHPTVKRIKQGEEVSDAELSSLIQTLNQADLFITEQNLREVFGAEDVPLLDLIRLAIGMIRLQTSSEAVGEAFDRYIIEHQHYSADQILFLRALRTVLVQEAERAQKVHFTYNDLFEPPFTILGRNAVERLFTREQIDELLSLVKQLAA